MIFEKHQSKSLINTFNPFHHSMQNLYTISVSYVIVLHFFLWYLLYNRYPILQENQKKKYLKL